MLIYRGYTIQRVPEGRLAAFSWFDKDGYARFARTEHNAMNDIDAYLRQLREQEA